MTIDNPAQLVNEFKKSGEFDRLREKLLQEVAQGSGMTILKKRVGEVAQQRFMADPKVSFMTTDAIHKELMEEMDRFPVVDRVAEDVQLLSDPSFTENISSFVRKILLEHKEQHPLPQTDTSEVQPIASATESTNRPPVEPEASGPSVVVTPATPFDGASNFTMLPPITTQKESAEQVREVNLETERETTDPSVAHSEPTSGGADIEMADGTQTDGNALQS